MEHSEKTGCKSCSKEPTETVNVQRFIAKLDECFAANDLEAAGKLIAFWKEEARALNDRKGLLSVLNEEIGFSRRKNDEMQGLSAVSEAIGMIRENDLTTTVSGATVLVNAATTLKAFGRFDEGLKLYDQAEKTYLEKGKQNDFEYAALLNNKAAALSDLKRYDEAEECYLRAIEILKREGKHDGEIAVSYINLAHLVFDRDGTAYERVEQTLDVAWEYINSPRQPHDANYAFILSKCAPSFRYFKRFAEAEALEEVAKEIYDERN